MYYEEKIIDGVMMRRNTPNGKWSPVDLISLFEHEELLKQNYKQYINALTSKAIVIAKYITGDMNLRNPKVIIYNDLESTEITVEYYAKVLDKQWDEEVSIDSKYIQMDLPDVINDIKRINDLREQSKKEERLKREEEHKRSQYRLYQQLKEKFEGDS